MKKNIKKLVISSIGIILIGICLYFGASFFENKYALGARTSNFWKTTGNKYETITDIPVNITGDLEFQDEIKPDGATCSNGQILKKTGADNWDCAADDTGGSLTVAQLGQIGDVSTTSPMNYGDMLRYNTGTSKWVSTTTPTAVAETDPVWTAVSGNYFLTSNYGTYFYNYLSATTTDALTEGSTNKYLNSLTISATGLTLTGTDIDLTAGYVIPTSTRAQIWDNKVSSQI